MSSPVNLDRYNNSWYRPGRGFVVRSLWLFVGLPLFRCSLLPFSSFRVALLRMFGAQVGAGAVIHSGVQIKYPWHMVVGDHCWIGEHVWIDDLAMVRLGNHVCISQGAYLCTGNHDWKDPAFGLQVQPIYLEDGAWAGAKCVLLPGARLEEGAVAAAGSVVSSTVPAYEIHAGNPAVFIKARGLRHASDPKLLRQEAPQ